MSAPPKHWTPDLVKAALVATMEWVRQSGTAGPAGYRSALPAMAMDIEDRLAAGWDAVNEPDEDDMRVLPTAEQITRYERALTWVGDILAPTLPDMAKAVNAAVLSEAYKISFPRLAYDQGLSKSRAYTLRDRGLAILSVQLERQKVTPWT